MSVCGWFSGGDRLDCCRLHAEELHPAHPGHQELLYFFCKVGARGSHQEIRGKNPQRTLKSCRGWSYGPSATLQRLRLGLWCGFIAKSSFREISQTNRESTRILARLLFAKSSFDEYFKQKPRIYGSSSKRVYILFLEIEIFSGDLGTLVP